MLKTHGCKSCGAPTMCTGELCAGCRWFYIDTGAWTRKNAGVWGRGELVAARHHEGPPPQLFYPVTHPVVVRVAGERLRRAALEQLPEGMPA